MFTNLSSLHLLELGRGESQNIIISIFASGNKFFLIKRIHFHIKVYQDYPSSFHVKKHTTGEV